MGWICNKCGIKHYNKGDADACCSQLIKKKRQCKHSRLDIRPMGWDANISEIVCLECKQTWKFNPALYYWSDSYVGTFVRGQDSKSNQEWADYYKKTEEEKE